MPRMSNFSYMAHAQKARHAPRHAPGACVLHLILEGSFKNTAEGKISHAFNSYPLLPRETKIHRVFWFWIYQLALEWWISKFIASDPSLEIWL